MLYGTKCWVVKNQHKRWGNTYSRKDCGNWHMWFGHLERIPQNCSKESRSNGGQSNHLR